MNTEAPATVHAQASIETATKHIFQAVVAAYHEAIKEFKSGNFDRDSALDFVQGKMIAAYDLYPQFTEDDVAGHSTFESTRQIADLREEFDKISIPNYDGAFEETSLNVESYRANLEAYTTQLVRMDREGENIGGLVMLEGIYLIDSYSSIAGNIMAVRAVEKRDGLEDEIRANLRKVKEILRKTIQK